VFCRLIAGDVEKGFSDVVLTGFVESRSHYVVNTATVVTLLTAVDGSQVKEVGLTRHAGDRNHAPADIWADAAPCELADRVRRRQVVRACRETPKTRARHQCDIYSGGARETGRTSHFFTSFGSQERHLPKRQQKSLEKGYHFAVQVHKAVMEFYFDPNATLGTCHFGGHSALSCLLG